ncbi:hypothetical protein ALP10_200090 [Pseudomonas syringae pv. helianthi]|uniref:Uncharacterized protein n=1 Tax=Pseudomonas syringae pv. helianthi TaxID=251654 RepID=A0A3M6CN50_9PSED|nr:hypothetical protein ALP10_200090 [Pseudomonas syringae pv. helianthi]
MVLRMAALRQSDASAGAGIQMAGRISRDLAHNGITDHMTAVELAPLGREH